MRNLHAGTGNVKSVQLILLLYLKTCNVFYQNCEYLHLFKILYSVMMKILRKLQVQVGHPHGKN